MLALHLLTAVVWMPVLIIRLRVEAPARGSLHYRPTLSRCVKDTIAILGRWVAQLCPPSPRSAAKEIVPGDRSWRCAW